MGTAWESQCKPQASREMHPDRLTGRLFTLGASVPTTETSYLPFLRGRARPAALREEMPSQADHSRWQFSADTVT